EVIAQNDIKQPQAILEIAILELSAQGSRTIDPSWGITAGTFSLGFSGGVFSVDFNNNVDHSTGKYIAGSSTEITSGNSASSYGDGTKSGSKSTTTTTLADQNFLGLRNRITIAMQQGKGRVLSNPKILVKNNVESTLDITQEYISNISTQQSAGGAMSSAVNSQTVETDDYGIKLSIKPTITPDGYIYMDLKPSYSVPNGSFQVDSNDEQKKMTLIAERDLELKGVRLKDNETLIIAGLIQETEDKASTKVPFLGDLPVIGVAFRSSARASNKNELIIIVTPKILNDDEPITERM
ncbi:MAG: type II and III secretion system protein, partial [Candidatus Gastranaerophilales bacterium]|nr:type II and III secretion system protein [Candidatus Gastranaerophilales bacterium]